MLQTRRFILSTHCYWFANIRENLYEQIYAKMNLKKKPYHCIKTLKIGNFFVF